MFLNIKQIFLEKLFTFFKIFKMEKFLIELCVSSLRQDFRFVQNNYKTDINHCYKLNSNNLNVS